VVTADHGASPGRGSAHAFQQLAGARRVLSQNTKISGASPAACTRQQVVIFLAATYRGAAQYQAGAGILRNQAAITGVAGSAKSLVLKITW